MINYNLQKKQVIEKQWQDHDKDEITNDDTFGFDLYEWGPFTMLISSIDC